jgi:hypothetical protein
LGKIIETNYHDTIEKVTGFSRDLINNSFYTLNDKRPIIVTYYNINKVASSLDPGSKLSYDNIGYNSSIRFNRITDFILYGPPRIELNTDIDEFGLEAEKITGELFVLPNTIIPIEGDYFEMDHVKDSTWLFIVTDVQQDTLKDGSNVYKIQYKLEYVDHDRILQQVVEDYKMIEKREGTNIVKIVETTKYEKAKEMDRVAVKLKQYFNELFYNKKVQTFIFYDLTEWRTYDPYMVEFLIRNKILANGNDSYIHVCHQLETSKTFTIEYDNTFFRAFELKSKEKLSTALKTILPEEIISYGTTFYGRYETYFSAKYIPNRFSGYKGVCIDDQLIYRILDNKLIDDDLTNDHPIPLWENILIKYFNGGEYTENEIKSASDARYKSSMKTFYIMPLLILCLESSIENLLK